LKLRGELRDRCRTLPFQRQKNGAAAVRKLVNGDDGDSPGVLVKVTTIKAFRRWTIPSFFMVFCRPALTQTANKSSNHSY
jgi:hypothetical protein